MTEERKYNDRFQFVYIFDEIVIGEIVKEGLYASVVKYSKDGIEYEILMDNEEFTVIQEVGFEHIEEYDEE